MAGWRTKIDVNVAVYVSVHYGDSLRLLAVTIPTGVIAQLVSRSLVLLRLLGLGSNPGMVNLFFYFIWFLPRDALLSAVYAVDVCLCVCVCVCHTPVLYQNG